MLTPFVCGNRTRAYYATIEHAVPVVPEQFIEARPAREKSRTHDFAGKKRNNTNPGKNIDAMRTAVRIDHEILEKTIRGVPQGYACAGMAGDRIGNREKLAVGLDGDLLVGWVFDCNFKSHDGKLQGEHSHPAGGIGLL